MNTVIYRIHYGWEILSKSIELISNWADKIYVCYDPTPWYRSETVMYKGEVTKIIRPENDLLAMDKFHCDKATVLERNFDTPKNQFGALFNELNEGHPTLLLEPDMVFKNYTALNALKDVQLFKQIELWKNEEWRIPARNRVGPVLINTNASILTHFSNVPVGIKNTYVEDEHVWNYGFCADYDLMLYKHLLALGFSSVIGDSIPSETWLDEKWHQWTPDTKNLEISANYTHLISHAAKMES
jgi:hypothetical protein